MRIERPALGSVVAALSGGRAGEVTAVTAHRAAVLSNPWGRERFRSWLYSDPAEAYEALVARGLAPPPDGRRRWLWTAGANLPAARGCGPCEGTGWWPQWHLGTTVPCARCNPDGLPSRGTGIAKETPPSHPALVAVASLGLGAWLRAEHLARESSPDDIVWYAAPLAFDGPRPPWSPPVGGPQERVDVALQELGVYRVANSRREFVSTALVALEV